MRCYFDLTDGALTLRDEDGVEVDDRDQALAEAERAVREVVDGGDLRGLPGQWTLVLRAEDGTTLASLPVA